MSRQALELQFIDRIYEAAVCTELWPSVLEDIGRSVGALGAVFIGSSQRGTDWICAPALERHMADYAAAGWAADPLQTAPLFADHYSGFRAETAYRTIAEIEALPVKRDFMIPRGLVAAAASVFQGAANDALYMTVEGFPVHGAAESAVPKLDLLRPHIGRALSLSAQIRQVRSDAVVAGLEIAGVGAAIIGSDQRLKARNASFEKALSSILLDRGGAIYFADSFLQAAMQNVIRQKFGPNAGVASVGVQLGDEALPVVVHLVPLLNRARDVCGSDGALMLIARPDNDMLPTSDLLRLLFDLTPAESRIARLLSEGLTLARVAQTTGTSRMTVRSQLRSVFTKMGVSRQAELVRLLLSIRTPQLPPNGSAG
jgi:DNA-binding CsgD family transcriptional regulator